VNIYFLNDPHSPTDLDTWQNELKQVKEELGFLHVQMPYTADIFLDTEDKNKPLNH